jgi:hypothetical protein
MIRIAILFVVASLPAFAQATVEINKFTGCYELSMSDWKPKLRDDIRYVQPPPKFELTTIKNKYDDTYVVYPATGAAPSVHSITEWEIVASNKIHVVWSTGFSGLVMDLERTSDGILKGKATTFWDYNNRHETSFATVKPISCIAPFTIDPIIRLSAPASPQTPR